MADHYTEEHEGRVGSIHTVEQARAAHHLATADPERDGTLTGAAHELKYGLARAEATVKNWIGQGVHPTENRALVGDEDGAENLRGAVSEPASVPDASAEDASKLETAVSPNAPENTDAPRAG